MVRAWNDDTFYVELLDLSWATICLHDTNGALEMKANLVIF